MNFIQKDYLKSNFKKNTIAVPIGTKKHMSQYRTRRGKYQVPPEDVVYIYSSPMQQLSLLNIMSTGAGKCAYSEVMTLTQNRGISTIKNLQIGDSILSYNFEKNINEFKEVVAKELNGIKPVYEIVTRSGQKISLTENHPVLTEYGFRQVKDLKVGWSVFSPKHSFKLEEHKLSREDELFLYISSYLVADGYLMKPSFYFTKNNKEEAKLFIDYVNELGYYPSIYSTCKNEYYLSKELSDLLRNKGLHIAKSVGKRLPDLIFQAPEKVKCHALSLLFDCDGSVNLRQDKKKMACTFEYCSKSKFLIQQIGLLLNSLGIQVKYLNPKGVEYYRLFIKDYYNLKLFQEKIGFNLERKNVPLKKYLDSVNVSQSNCLNESIPYAFLNEDIKKDFDEVDFCVWFDEIKEINYLGEKETWDIEIEDNANFFAGDVGLICVHNSRLLKRILPYLINEHKWNALLFDCKGFELYHGKFKTQNYNGLLPWEQNKVSEIGAMDLRCYMPSFVRKKAEGRGLLRTPSYNYLNDFDIFSYHQDDIEDILEASTLGLAPTARMIFLDKVKTRIKKGEFETTGDLVSWLKTAKINFAVRDNMINVFSYLANERFFDMTKPRIDVISDWKHDITPMISLLEPPHEMASFYVGKIINDAYKRENSKKNKLVVIDDASKVIGKKQDSKKQPSLSIDVVKDLLTLGRYRKWHVNALSQSYSLLDESLFPLFNYKIFSKLGSSDLNLISNFCSGDIIYKLKHLRYIPEKNIIELLLVNPDNMTSFTFFPLAPLAYHI